MLRGYHNIVQRMAGKEVDAAFPGSFTGALGQRSAEPRRLLHLLSYIFVRKDSDITSVSEMLGSRPARSRAR